MKTKDKIRHTTNQIPVVGNYRGVFIFASEKDGKFMNASFDNFYVEPIIGWALVQEYGEDYCNEWWKGIRVPGADAPLCEDDISFLGYILPSETETEGLKRIITENSYRISFEDKQLGKA